MAGDWIEMVTHSLPEFVLGIVGGLAGVAGWAFRKEFATRESTDRSWAEHLREHQVLDRQLASIEQHIRSMPTSAELADLMAAVARIDATMVGVEKTTNLLLDFQLNEGRRVVS